MANLFGKVVRLQCESKQENSWGKGGSRGCEKKAVAKSHPK